MPLGHIFAFYGNFREGFFALTFSFVYSTAARSSELLRKLYSEVMNPICNNCEMLVIALVLIFHSTSSTTALTLKYFRFFHALSDFERTHTRSRPTAWCWAPNLGVHANLWIWSDYQSSKLIKDAFDSWRVAKSFEYELHVDSERSIDRRSLKSATVQVWLWLFKLKWFMNGFDHNSSKFG